MTQYLPPQLLALFAPRPPLKYLPPPVKLAHEKPNRGYGPMSACIKHFEGPKDTPKLVKAETKLEKRERRKREKLELATYKTEQAIALWDPNDNPNATTDPYKTLFVARLNYDTSESKLKREFEYYGPIKSIRMVTDRHKKPRGYAFIQFHEKKDMHEAYKRGDNKKIDGRRVLVDVERGRLKKGWLPRRLGGGLGGRKNT